MSRRDGAGRGRRSRLVAHAIPYALLIGCAGAVAAWLWIDVDALRAPDAIVLQAPWALWLAAAGVLVFALAIHGRVRRAARLRYSRVGALAATRPGVVARLASLPAVLRALVLVLLALALARPQTYSLREIEVEGIDLMIALDLSQSMGDRDMERTRLDAGQRTIRRFLRGRHNDRIGLVVFARDVMLECPLTLDYRALDQIVAGLQIGDIRQRGTAIGDGLGLALASLRRSEARSRVVILISDGENNIVDAVSPLEAKQFAVEMGVVVFTVLMGREVDDASGDDDRPRYGVDPALLEDIATATGGEYFNAPDAAALESSFAAVRNQLDRSRLRITGRVFGELFVPFAWAAAMLLALELLLGFTRWRRFP